MVHGFMVGMGYADWLVGIVRKRGVEGELLRSRVGTSSQFLYGCRGIYILAPIGPTV